VIKSKQENQKTIASVFTSNGISSTLIIPIKLARKHSIDGLRMLQSKTHRTGFW